jgi:hypothetical protein
VKRTSSIWSFIDAHKTEFLNPLYGGEKNLIAKSPIIPNPPMVKLWSEYFLRWSTHSFLTAAREAILRVRDETMNESVLNLSSKGLGTMPSNLPLVRIFCFDDK